MVGEVGGADGLDLSFTPLSQSLSVSKRIAANAQTDQHSKQVPTGQLAAPTDETRSDDRRPAWIVSAHRNANRIARRGKFERLGVRLSSRSWNAASDRDGDLRLRPRPTSIRKAEIAVRA
jgi:hypothetical protein